MAKIIDSSGNELFRGCKLTKEQVVNYSGAQIDPNGMFGLDPNRIYSVYRPAKEINKKSFIDSLEVVPLLDEHPSGAFDGGKEKKVMGCLYNIKWDARQKALIGDLKVMDNDLKRKIARGVKELSLGYGVKYVRKMGIFEGKPYDFIQTDLMGDHVALVPEGRAGSDCCVRDSKTFASDSMELPDMDITKMSADELIEALRGCDAEVVGKVKDALCAPSEEEKKAAEEKAAADAEAAKKAEEEQAKKVEDEKKEAVDAAVEEQKKADEKACEDACAKAADAAITEYKKVIALAADCKSRFGEIALDGIKTERDLAVKVCALDAAPSFLKSVKPEEAVVALRGCLAGSVAMNKTQVADSAKSAKQSFASWMKTR